MRSPKDWRGCPRISGRPWKFNTCRATPWPIAFEAGANRFIGDYELLNEIARGGMGIVYRARQRSLNRLVAIKLIREGAKASADDARRFQTEDFGLGRRVAQLFGLSDIRWSGVISQNVLNNVIGAESDDLQLPNPSSLLGSLGSSLFSLGDGIPVLGPLANTLNQPLPLIGESIGQLTDWTTTSLACHPCPRTFQTSTAAIRWREETSPSM